MRTSRYRLPMKLAQMRERARERNRKLEADWAEKRRLSPTQAYVAANAHLEIASCGPVHLFARCVVTARRRGGLTPKDQALREGIAEITGTTARVVSDGQLLTRSDLARSILSDGWQRTEDHRTFFLEINGPTFQWVIPLDGPQMAADARMFAAQLNTLGRGSSLG